ncbi:hypothetical protein QR680_007061 [Steinernema hermaphroditum]|uniref:Uncharacterized protein n=1 Tax=Steinernema hermaphroditum TaxID=289476 RepID=A0AA39HZQ5_9BILA|nr:hypothetical protein QR680_007061 [Steinernema hermaphroditum]
MLSDLAFRVTFLDTAVGFFIAEFFISFIHLLTSVVFTIIFAYSFFVFLFSVDGFLAGVDLAVFLLNFAALIVAFFYDTVKLPCCFHLIMAGFTMNSLYTLRLVLGFALWSPLVSLSSNNTKRFFSAACTVYFCACCFLLAVHLSGIVFFGAVARKYKEEKRRFLGCKEV